MKKSKWLTAVGHWVTNAYEHKIRYDKYSYLSNLSRKYIDEWVTSVVPIVSGHDYCLYKYQSNNCITIGFVTVMLVSETKNARSLGSIDNLLILVELYLMYLPLDVRSINCSLAVTDYAITRCTTTTQIAILKPRSHDSNFRCSTRTCSPFLFKVEWKIT